jgi:diguanylate cyclase (GGDEF)-like protein
MRLLIVCAAFAIASACVGGVFDLRNTRSSDSDARWLTHTHEVMESLLLDSARFERIDFGMQLFKATGDEEHLRFVETSMVSVDAGLLRLQDQIRDNPSQVRHVQELDQAVRDLSRAIESSRLTRAIPERELRDCRSLVKLMQNEEQNLLEQRTLASRESVIRGYLWGTAYIGLSLVVLVALFAILIRDAMGRDTFEDRLSLANSDLASSVEALGHRVDEAGLLKNARDELQLCITPKEAYDCIARHFEQLLPGSGGATMIINNSRSLLGSMSSWNRPAVLPESFETDLCCGLRAGRPRWRRPGESEIHCGHFIGTPPESYLCIPLSALGETLGFVFIDLPDAEVSQLAERRLAMVYELVEIAAMATAGLNLRARLENQSIRDGLTKLFNRHFMDIVLERELQRATRHGFTLALLMIDIDHFKNFNDTFGHEAGDLILREVADCLQHAVRTEDTVCRYGGEEFVVLLPEISEHMAMARANNMRELVGAIQMRFRGEPLRQVTISIGVATYPAPARDAVELLRIADRGLYEAKTLGRNQVQMLDFDRVAVGASVV